MLVLPAAIEGAAPEVFAAFIWGCTKVIERVGAVPGGKDVSEKEADSAADKGEGSIRFADEADVTSKDYYAILGLKKLRWSASDEDIRRAYRQCILKFHPDKLNTKSGDESEEGGASSSGGAAAPEESDEGFKALYKAYETLSDPAKRRLYDSSDDFDDSIPSDRQPKDFFAEYGPVFESNARWSINKPCPLLGNDSTSMEIVDAFYEFWFDFQSWREMKGSDEFNLDDAGSRDERRWMERKNAKERLKLKTKENERIRSLVETAYKWDPRIRRAKEAEKEAKEAKKKQKAAAAEKKDRQKAEYLAQKEREEAERKEQAKLAKLEKEKIRKEMSLHRKRIRELADGRSEVSPPGVELVLADATLQLLQTIVSAMEDDIVTGMARLKLEFDTIDAANAEKREAEKQKLEAIQRTQAEEEAKRKAATEQDSKPWKEDELADLLKAYAKFPGGTNNRWDTIARSLGTGRSGDEVLKEINQLRKAGTLGMKQVIRQQAAAAPSLNTAAANIVQHAKEQQQHLKETANSTPSAAAAAPASPAPAPAAGGGGGAAAASPAAAQKNTIPAAASPAQKNAPAAPAAAAAATNEAVDEEGWTKSQQQSLESALQKFPGTMAADERWNAIAESVQGKTRKECIARYKSLRAKLMGAKTTA